MSGELVYRVLGNRKCLQVLSFQFLCNKISFLHVHIFLYMSYIVFFFICLKLYFSLCVLHVFVLFNPIMSKSDLGQIHNLIPGNSCIFL